MNNPFRLFISYYSWYHIRITTWYRINKPF